MSGIARELTAGYLPHSALIMYRNHEYLSELNEWYIEYHEMQNGQMLAGAPLTEAALKDIGDFFIKQKEKANAVKGLIPEHMIYTQPRNNGMPDMIWYRKPEKRRMFFHQSLHLPSGEAHVPGLLYVASGGLNVYAIKGKKRPGASTKLYQAPFHNCNNGGGVCLGSAKITRPEEFTWDNMINFWEDYFWKTEFSHLGSARIKGNMNTMWKELVENPDRQFDNSLLIDTKRTLKNIIV